MLIDLTTPQNQGYIQAIASQLNDAGDLQAFNDFVSQFSTIDPTDPNVQQAIGKSCGGRSCSTSSWIIIEV